MAYVDLEGVAASDDEGVACGAQVARRADGHGVDGLGVLFELVVGERAALPEHGYGLGVVCFEVG